MVLSVVSSAQVSTSSSSQYPSYDSYICELVCNDKLAYWIHTSQSSTG